MNTQHSLFSIPPRRKLMSANLFVLLSLLSTANFASAATYSINAVLSGVHNPADLSPAPTFTPGDSLVYQVDFYLEAYGFSGNQRGFGAIEFHINLSPGLTHTTIPGYIGDTIIGDYYHNPAPGPLWLRNGDIGDLAGAPDDLQYIEVAIPVIYEPTPDDPRPKVGQYPTYMGTLYVDWDGTSDETLTVTTTNAAYASTVGPPRPGAFIHDLDAVLLGDTLDFTPAPAASSSSLFLEYSGSGDTDGDGDVDFTDFLNLQNGYKDSPLGDSDSDGDTDIYDYENIMGQFGATIATSASGGVPEPASAAIFTLLGAALFVRRRT